MGTLLSGLNLVKGSSDRELGSDKRNFRHPEFGYKTKPLQVSRSNIGYSFALMKKLSSNFRGLEPQPKKLIICQPAFL